MKFLTLFPLALAVAAEETPKSSSLRGATSESEKLYYYDHRRDWSHRSNGTPWSVRPNGQPWSEPYDPYSNDGIIHRDRGRGYDRGGGSAISSCYGGSNCDMSGCYSGCSCYGGGEISLCIHFIWNFVYISHDCILMLLTL